MTTRGLNRAWFTLLLLAVACTSEGEVSVVSPTMPVSTTEAVAQSAPTVTTVSPDTVVESEVSPQSTTTSTVTETPSTTGPPSDVITSLAATSTTGPLTTTTTSTTTTTTTTLPDDLTVVEVVVREGRVVSKDRVDVVLGNGISLRFDSDARLLVHIHGYDEEFSVEAGVLTTHEMVGDLPGIFEVEDHVTHRLLIELKVSP